MVTTICGYCQNEFEAARSSARYCSEACKQKAKRTRSPQVVAAIGADPRDDGDLEERLHLAELERDIWQRVFHVAAELGITFRKP